MELGNLSSTQTPMIMQQQLRGKESSERSSTSNNMSPLLLESFSIDQVKKIFQDLDVEISLIQRVAYDCQTGTMTETNSHEESNAWAVRFTNSVKYPVRLHTSKYVTKASLITAMAYAPKEIDKVWVLPFHFDLESAEAIAKFCAHEGHDSFNSVIDEDVWIYRKQLEFSTFNAEIKSTNFYLLTDSWVMKLHSIYISAIQIAILIVVISDLSANSNSVQRSNGQQLFVVLFLIPFVAYYISSTMVNSLSDQAMAAVVNVYALVPNRYQNIAFGVLFACVVYAFSPFVLLYFGLVRSRISFCFLIELVVSSLAVFAISAIITSQSQFIDILFNFTGVLVVLDVDDRVAAMQKCVDKQGHLSYRNHVVKNGYSLTGDFAENVRRGLGLTISIFFYLFLTVKFVAVDANAANEPPPTQGPSSV